ncbi:MAG: recombinase family protein [Alteripontixanthobacter sp.]
MGQTITAMVDEQRAIDNATYTRKSRRTNARKGYYNGGPVAFGYQTYAAHTDGKKQRMKLKLVPDEAAVVEKVFDWAEQGRGGRSIVKTLNDRGITLRGAKFTNGNLAGIIGREAYTGRYFDKTAEDDGSVPERDDWIEVPCPQIIDRDQFERVAALRVSRSPRQMAPHEAAGTTLLSGLAKCGMPGCSAGMTIGSGTSRSRKKTFLLQMQRTDQHRSALQMSKRQTRKARCRSLQRSGKADTRTGQIGEAPQRSDRSIRRKASGTGAGADPSQRRAYKAANLY